MRSFFPYERDIPADMLEDIPVDSNDYLDNGKVMRWNGPFREVHSPLLTCSASGLLRRTIGQVPSMDERASMNALSCARDVFSNGKGRWPSLPLGERIERFGAFLARMEEVREKIVRLLQWEIGKTRHDAGEEFDRAVSYARECFEELREMRGRSEALIADNGVTGRLVRVPKGVTLVMGPFNYPLFETMTAFAPAMLTGNTVIIKPPRLGCLFFQHLLKPFQDNFPAGSINVVCGEGKNVIPPILASGMVDVFYFIGTSPVATYLRGLHPKPHRLKCILGLEAKNPAIVLPDADLDITVRECAMGALTFNGQRCAALKIFFVHRSIANEFNERLKDAIAGLRYGMPWEKDVFLTPLAEVNRTQYLSGLVDDALSLGAQVINDGGADASGTFFYPAILYPAAQDMRVCREEQFGPVIPVVPYDDLEEPVRYVMGSNYGQQASIFGRDKATLSGLISHLVHHVSRVNVNCQCQRSPDTIPFTGRKDSAEGSLSITEAMSAFTVPAFIATKNGKGDVDIIEEMFNDKGPGLRG